MEDRRAKCSALPLLISEYRKEIGGKKSSGRCVDESTVHCESYYETVRHVTMMECRTFEL